MKSNLKIILSAIGVAALLASPAMARSQAHFNGAAVNAPAQQVYAPNVYVPRHQGELTFDRQLGGER
jgi:hypothetical protein